jgi:hypothetical protein
MGDQGRPGAELARLESVWGQPEPGQISAAGFLQLASRLITRANQQAAEIRQDARHQTATSLAKARREAAELLQQASDRAAATLAVVELQTAELQTAVMKLSAQLGGVTEHVTDNLLTSAAPAIQPVSRPGPGFGVEPSPAARPAAKPGARPRSGPAAEPGTRPAAEPGTRPKGTPRQLVAARVAAVATAALVLFAVAAGTAEVALHGLPFFVFRSIGTGETGPNGLQEDQGPGQPDAPKPTPSRINGRSSPRSTVTVHHGQ